MAYLLMALLVLLIGGVAAHFTLNSRNRAYLRRQRREDHAHRVLMAEQRIAENGGLPLSFRPAKANPEEAVLRDS